MKAAENIRETARGLVADCPHCGYSFMFSSESFGVDVCCPECDKSCLMPKEDGTVPTDEEYAHRFLQKFGEAMLQQDDEDE